MKVACITHRRDPIFRGSLEGTLPGSYSENSVMSSVQRAGIAWNILNGAGIPGVLDVYAPPITNGVNIRDPDQEALPGPAQADRRRALGQQRRAISLQARDRGGGGHRPGGRRAGRLGVAHRVNAGRGRAGGLPGHLRLADRSQHADGGPRRGAARHRPLESVLFDATRSWKNERRPEWGGERFPPTVRPSPEDEARVRRAGRSTGSAMCRSGRDFSHDMVLDCGARP